MILPIRYWAREASKCASEGGAEPKKNPARAGDPWIAPRAG